MITIVDYGMGNLGSVYNMFKRIGAQSLVTSDLDVIMKAEKIILPGVGSFDHAMQRISETGMLEVLNTKALKEKIPVLGICLGMQLLTESSEEGVLPGLGWIPGHAMSFAQELKSKDKGLKIPHMGWNEVVKLNDSAITRGFDDNYKFYFVHSYFVKCKEESHVVLKTSYGLDFDSGIQRENIFGVQFHPEKSHKYGMKVFENFAKL